MRRSVDRFRQLMLSAEERGTLENWARRPKTAQATALRARLILGCAAGKTNTAVARELRVTKQTVGKWRSRFVAKRLDGLLDEPRPGAPRTVTDAAVERVVTLTLETTPRDATHWSTRAMARQCGLRQSTVSLSGAPSASSLIAPRRSSSRPIRSSSTRSATSSALHAPARQRARALHRREDPDPNLVSQPTTPTHAPSASFGIHGSTNRPFPGN